MKNKNVWKWIMVWFLALVLTGIAMVYQSINGPTKPRSEQLWLNDSQVYRFRLPRSNDGKPNCLIEVAIPDINVQGELHYKRYLSSDEWQKVNMVRADDKLAGFLPNQPNGGKLEYFLKFKQDGKVFRVPVSEQIVIRYRGDVPAGVILPHVLFMTLSMLFSSVALFLALLNMKAFKLYGVFTLSALIIGGFIFGPIVQKYSFGLYWTGFPVGMDLTDNKTLIAGIFWIIAVLVNLKNNRRFITIAAAILLIAIFTIPHSVRGSQLNIETGRMETGMIIVPALRF
jgi:hypothetical protein